MPTYDLEYFTPPAPVAEVEVSVPDSGQTVPNVKLLVDSGADVTLLPRSAAEQSGVVLDANPRYEVAGFDGKRTLAHAVILDMTFLEKTFRGVYLPTDEEVGILGRDVLNSFRILLDGPANTWSQVD